MQVEDSEIIEKFSRENTRHESFNLLLKKYQKKIYWHIRRLVIDHDDTDDLVQDVFIKVWKNLANFRSDSQLFTWIYRIATNESITFLNRKKLRNSVSLDDSNGLDLAEKLADSPYFDGDKAQMKLQKAILTLPEKQRLVFNMKYFDDLKQKGKTQIGFVLNLDDHNQSGSHWVGVFVDLDKKGVYYYDSVGKKPEELVVNFMNKVKNYFKQKGVPDKDIKIGHNKVQHQHGNTECGVYSIRFLLQMIKGIDFDEFCNNKFSDKKINKCRIKYFRINPKN